MASHLQTNFDCVRKPTLMNHCWNGFKSKVKLEPQSVGQFQKLKLSNLLQCLVLLILHAPLDGLTGQKLGITFAVDDCIENCLFLHLVSAEVPVVYNYQPKAWTTRDIFSVGMIFFHHGKKYQQTTKNRKDATHNCHNDLLCTYDGAVEKDENENVHVSDKPNEGLSHSKAHSCHKATFKWMELQKAAPLTLIRHIHDVAAQNKLSSFKQKLITDYIEYDSN
ncbi:hypothetical protein T03_5256 [Trichinella britovi]|uniref:Uncharacterized protein n=1 Tax=Trichinella britovi TaxID=45882 RepID=A0A0V1CA30_TRIBR|nr:hypothetical protein T03_5256 [Trichinella britovi]